MAAEEAEIEEFDVIIVGGGVSGLTAAYQLWKKDPSLRVGVLEAKDRIGGRTVGVELQGANGRDTWDLGGSWVSVCQPHIMGLLKELSLETYDEFIDGKKVMQLGSNKVGTYRGEIPSLPFYALLDLHLFLSKADKLVRFLDPEDPSTFHLADQWDGMTFEDMMNKRLWTKGARDAINATIRCMFGVEASQMSLLYYGLYTAAAGGIEPLISAKKNVGGQEMKIKGGAWRVCHKLIEKIGKDKVHLSHPVARISQTDEGVTVQTISGIEYQCQRLILALPPHQAAKIDFSPGLPADKNHVLHRMPVGNVTKIIVTYKTSFWRAAGYSGEGVTNGGLPILDNVDSGPLCVIYDAQTSGGNPALVAFIGGCQHLQYADLKPSDRKRAVLHSLSELYGKEALDILDYGEKNWSNEAYSVGGPVSVGTPGMMKLIGPGLRKPNGRLHFAGTESATVWCGFINGAVQSGYRAANEVLYNLRPQVITSTDLEGTAYDRTARKPRHSSNTGTRLLRWAIGLGTIAAAVFIVRKHLPKGIL